ncbi:hypothetical protein EV182_005821 [Spiromyces aspiralis]|uniref:Uncharacterized protein n=1 Tax=Spiromyces aspiralis TaxID=68401 RepID=A0ACC1H9R0_9FUNG|nr:hypothetical protein EV182_005821 [Spiromyces aspiralis]
MIPFLPIPEIPEFSASADQNVYDFIESIDSYITYFRNAMTHGNSSNETLPVSYFNRLAIQQAIARTSGNPKHHPQVWSSKPGVTWDEIKEKLAERLPYTLGAREVIDRLNSMTKKEDEPLTLLLDRFEQVAARSRHTIPSDFLLEAFLGLLPLNTELPYTSTYETRTWDNLREFLQRWDENTEYIKTISHRARSHSPPADIPMTFIPAEARAPTGHIAYIPI